MSKLIKSNYVELEKTKIIGYNKLEEENKASVNSNHFLNVKEKSEKADLIAREARANIEKLEKLKIKLQKESIEITENANELSNQIIEDANSKYKSIIDEANSKAAQIYLEKEKEGFTKGYNESLEKYNYLIKDSQEILKEAEEYKRQIIANQEKEIVNLILNCVNKIIKTKIEEDDELVMNIITSSIEELNSRKNLIVKISREDFNETAMVRNKILAMFPGVKDIEIKLVDSYSKGDIEIESDEGTVNPSIKSQFIKLREEFSKLLEDDISEKNI